VGRVSDRVRKTILSNCEEFSVLIRARKCTGGDTKVRLSLLTRKAFLSRIHQDIGPSHRRSSLLLPKSGIRGISQS
jgi:hypothetical protein